MLFSLLLTIIGLSLFEVISSIDNAIINAEVLSTMGKKARRWFSVWGFLFAVFIVRGTLPLLIVFLTNPSLGIWGALMATFSQDPKVIHAIEMSSPLLLIGGGVFLLFLFFHWLFLEPKTYGLKGERFFHSKGVWFYTVVSVLLTIITWLCIQTNPYMALGAVIGSTAFFITDGFKRQAEEEEKKLFTSVKSDMSKILYLEIIDATFSIDGVLGAFAFTLAVPLILLGNGLGAFMVRQITLGNIERIKRYVYLKNGAMYSILLLGIVMICDSFSWELPSWVSPIGTMTIVLYFFLKSKDAAKQNTL